MNQSTAVWLLIALAFTLANLPFINERLLGFIPISRHRAVKAFWIRCSELMLFYVVLGLVARAFESSIGNVAPQQWEFYAITASLFAVMAFPGFIFRYLLKR